MPNTREKGHQVKPSEHRAPKSLAAILLAVAAMLALTAAPAAAHKTRFLSTTFGSAGSGAGQLSLLSPEVERIPGIEREELLASGSGLAVNDETGDVYVADTGNHRIAQFSSAGAFSRAWGWGVKDGASEFQVCTTLTGCQAGISGSASGQFEAPTFIAVDNAASSLSKGDVYVADTGDDTVSKFDPEGQIVGSWGTAGQLSGFTEVSGISVDTSGNLYVLEHDRTVHVFTDTGAETSTFTAPRGASADLATDAEGHFYSIFTEEARITKFSETGQLLVEELNKLPDAVGIGIDPSTNDLYVDEKGEAISGFALNCPLQPLHCVPSEEFGAGALSGAAGLAIAADRSVYVADAGHQRIVVFSGPVAIPDVTTTAASEVTNTTARLHGEVDPDGVALKPSPSEGCFFEYGETESYGQIAPCEEPAADEIDGSGPIQVHADIAALTPGLFYHYRLVAANANGTETGHDISLFTFSPPPPGPETCLNAVLREENNSLALPDCRAYEQVSPDDHSEVYIPERRSGAGGATSPYPMQAAAEGNKVTYLAEIPAHGSGGEGTGNSTAGEGDQLLASRGASGWLATDISPLGANQSTYYEGFSADLSRGLLVTAGREAGPLAPEVETTCSVPYSRATALPGAYTPLFTTESTPCNGGSTKPGRPFFVGSSGDGSHQLFESAAAKPEAQPAGAKKAPGQGHENIYDSAGGQLYLVNVLPGATPKAASNATVGSFTEGEMQGGGHDHPAVDTDHAVSTDGSRIFWTDLATNIVYVRQNDTSAEAECAIPQAADKSCTLQVSAGAAVYRTATPDGRYAYYTEAGQLWRFDVEAGTRQALTPAGAEVQGVTGINETGEDGSYLYFVADAVLTGSEENANHETAIAGKPNLYLIHGATKFLATLSPGDNDFGLLFLPGAHLGDWSGNLGFRSARPTPDGAHLVFMSQRRLTAYDNLDPTGVSVPEIYLYDAGSGGISCASCDPTGAPPPPFMLGSEEVTNKTEGNNLPFYANVNILHMPQFVSASGDRVFFNSTYSLVPSDTNGLRDVYEWERAGTGSCATGSALNGGGCIYLLSGAEQGRSSILIDAGESGGDVFFATEASLTPAAHVDQPHLYDARVGGGFPVPSELPICEAEACKGPVPSPPPPQTPGTATFQANEPPVVKCKKGQVKKHARCVRKKHRSKHHKSKKRHSNRTAHNNRRVGQ